ncbi:VOC family protein [Paucisalibacillus globulus]|uniref:VOC family protein n=1 Tax=Paucisalibacillus globulus TaxID=351095 RepID=UPI0004792FF1|nr:VOC family protein [Paucisalibacillus globulus]
MGRIVGFEISSQDPERAVAFYEAVFGWEIAEPKWDYWAVSTKGDSGSSIQGGISKGPSDYPHGTRIQIEVDSIEETILKATEYGAQVVREKMEFDEFFLAYLVDPTGVGFGLFQSK